MHYQTLLRFNQVCELTGLARSTVYTRIDPKSAYYDPYFPKPFPYGPRLVCFNKVSIEKWIQKQIGGVPPLETPSGLIEGSIQDD
jgi:prophage regulatory protein